MEFARVYIIIIRFVTFQDFEIVRRLGENLSRRISIRSLWVGVGMERILTVEVKNKLKDKLLE